MKKIDLQPVLESDLLVLRPLRVEDFQQLFEAAKDPLIWEQHPFPDRYKQEVFKKFFDEAIQSNGAFAILDKSSGKIIGSSRYYEYRPQLSDIVIGFTFLNRAYWGGRYNLDLKRLMINHIFQFVDSVLFHVGERNLRSQKAMTKIGGELINKVQYQKDEDILFRYIYRIRKIEWND